jgi:hypothetical protein
MNLISTEHGQALQLFVSDEVRPPTGLYLPDVIRQISEKYAFAVVPTNYETVMKEGAKYKDGRLVTEGRMIVIKDLGFFVDGVLAITWNTEDAEVVLNDLIVWATQNYGFREPRTKLPRRFVSSVVVEFDVELSGALTAFDGLQEGFAAAIKKSHGVEPEINASRITFAADPTKLLRSDPPFEFNIERRGGRPFSENRYFSSATLTTASHLNLLEAFEQRLLTGQ